MAEELEAEVQKLLEDDEQRPKFDTNAELVLSNCGSIAERSLSSSSSSSRLRAGRLVVP